MSFDHGAQHFTARSDGFREQVEDWCERGIAAPWRAEVVRLEGGHSLPEADPVRRYVGVPKMSVLAHDLGRDLELRFAVHVEALEPSGSVWNLVARDGKTLESFDAVILATPAAQTLPLLPRGGGIEPLASRIEGVEVDPCQAVLASFPTALETGFDAAFVRDSPPGWAARNNSKPRRPEGENWVLHATPEWSRTQIEPAPEKVGSALVDAFCEALGQAPGHRWRYARTRVPLWQEAAVDRVLWDAELGVGICGDWLIGSRVEEAFRSGRALARAILDAS